MGNYRTLKNKVLKTGKITPNLEARARVERSIKQNALFLQTKQKLGSVSKAPSYMEKFLNTFDTLIDEATKRQHSTKTTISEPTFSIH